MTRETVRASVTPEGLPLPAPPVPVERMLASPAKVLCSALWVSDRDPDEAIPNSVLYAMRPGIRELIDIDIDFARREVSLSMSLDHRSVPGLIEEYRAMHPGFEADWNAERERLLAEREVTRTARFTGDQGSVILPLDGSGLRFTPAPVSSALPPSAEVDWPMGDRHLDRGRSRADRERVAKAVDAAFADPDACTAAFVVVHEGDLIAERYAPGFGPESQLESWSMGKSITATFVGLLVQAGLLDLDEPAPVAAWQEPGDPRGAIRLRDLMRMSSGLRFSGTDDPRSLWEYGVPDHTLVYSEAIDVFAFSTSRPVEHPPDSVGRYRNCDPLTLGSIVQRIVEERLGEPYLTWPQRALFDRIGVRRQVLEVDAWGHFILTGFDYGTARNWARLGLLYLQDGAWEGTRLLPEGFVDFVRTPAPAWERPEYGAQFWLNRPGTYRLPRDAYYMGGAGEQRVFVVPSLDLVVVRQGHRRGAERAAEAVNRALERIVAAVEDGQKEGAR